MTESEAKHILEEVKILDDSMYQYNMNYLNALDVTIKSLEEIQQYRVIGTVEECREARKRYTEIKPIKGKAFKTIGYYQRSVCRCLLMQYEKFCDNCGQKLDWSE